MNSQLKTQASELLSSLQNGDRIDRVKTIEFLKNVIGDTDNAVAKPDFKRDESTPVRMQISNWNLTKCKRCLVQGAPDGSVIVRIHGVGWWHDDCYRKVNPGFYKDL
jgi:hypothetical protein